MFMKTIVLYVISKDMDARHDGCFQLIANILHDPLSTVFFMSGGITRFATALERLEATVG
jgi:hypothetical protein